MGTEDNSLAVLGYGLAALGNAGMFGMAGEVTWGLRGGLGTGFIALVAWGLMLVYLSRLEPSQARQSENQGTLDRSDHPPIIRGDRAEEILENFRHGRDI